MNKTITENLNDFAAKLQAESIVRLQEQGLACEGNIIGAQTRVKLGAKYAKVDIGSSGRFMVEILTGNIYGIKGYGQVHKGHQYGTLDTINDWFWGGYYPVPAKPSPVGQFKRSAQLIFAAPNLMLFVENVQVAGSNSDARSLAAFKDYIFGRRDSLVFTEDCYKTFSWLREVMGTIRPA